MAIPVPQPDVFSIAPILNAWQAGSQMRMVEEDRARAEEARMEEAISRMAYAADTPEKWGQFLQAIQRRFPDADLGQFQDFSTREMAIGMGLTVPEQFNMDIAGQQFAWQGQDRAEAARRQAALDAALTGLLEGEQVPGGTPSVTGGDWMRAGAGADQAPETYRNAIASIESAGSGDYQAVGPVTDGDRPYGRYQVMGANVGPWTEQVLGRRMTPQEFLANPEAQDAVFDAIFGGYVRQYGPSGAAQAWFGGPGSVGGSGQGADILGTTGNEYVRRFNAAIGMEQQGGVNLTDQQRAMVHGLIDGGRTDAALQIILSAMQPPEPPTYGFTEVDGTLLATNERTGAANPVYQAAPGQGDPTDDIQEYEFYAAQERAANRVPKSFEQWQLQRPASMQVINNLGPNGIDVGDAPTNHAWARNPDGTVKFDERGAPIALPIGPALADQEADAERATAARAAFVSDSQNVIRTIDEALEMAAGGNVGFFGGLFGRFELGTPQFALNQLLGTVATNVGINEIQQMRERSPTGGAVGQVTVQEWERFERSIQSLRQGLPEPLLRANLYEVKASFFDAIHGSGNWFYDEQGGVMLRLPDGTTQPWSYQRPADQLPPELRPQATNAGAATTTTPVGQAPAVRNPLQAGLLPVTELTPQNYNDAFQNAIKPISQGGRGLTPEQAMAAIAGQFGLTVEQMFQHLGQRGTP